MAFSTDDFLQMIDPAQLYGFGKRRTILIWTRLLSTILVLYVVVFTVVTDQDPTLYALYATYWLTMLIFLYVRRSGRSPSVSASNQVAGTLRWQRPSPGGRCSSRRPAPPWSASPTSCANWRSRSASLSL